VSDIESDLRATTENVLADAEKLAEIEVAKARLPADDPKMVPCRAKRSQSRGISSPRRLRSLS
jgi:hypothetical protein